jgi:acyl-CoA thioester hydrolase
MEQPYTTTIRVYYEDTDAGGIVYYANYLKFFERARSDWLRTLQVTHLELRERHNAMFVVHQASLTCHKPARLDDLLEVSVALTQCRRASMTMHQTATCKGSIIAQAQVSVALLDVTTMRPTPMPESLLQQLK